MHHIFSNCLKLYKLLSEKNLRVLNALKKKDFRRVLQEKAFKQNKAKFSECFQNFIENHEDKIFLKDKKSLSKEDILKKLPSEYHNFIEVFLLKEADKLPPHRSFDHKIELKSGENSPCLRNCPISAKKLEVVKKFLDEHLQKEFIHPSSSSAAAPMLLARKPGGGI